METQTMTAGARPAKKPAAKAAAKTAKKVAPDDAAKAAKVAEREKQAADATLKKAAAKEAQEKAQATTLKNLAPVAKEIVVRIEKAEKHEHDAEDHRVAAALQLASAERQCKEVGLNFKKWWEENGKGLAYETVRKLTTAGASGDESKTKIAIADMRAKNAAANRSHRAKKKTASRDTKGNGADVPATPAAPKMTPFKTADMALQALPEDVALELLKGKAHKIGMAVVSATEAKALKAAPAAATAGLLTPDKGKKTSSNHKAVCAAFDMLNTDAKFEVIQHIQKQTGAKFVSNL